MNGRQAADASPRMANAAVATATATAAAAPAKRLALAVGDPNGIGPEIALKALAALDANDRSRIRLFGPTAVVEATARQLGMTDLLADITLSPAGDMAPGAHVPGRISAAAGESAIASATAAIEACRRGEVDAVVACPHHETAIHQAGIAFSGYPSLVARICGMPEDRVFLMLVGGGLRIVHVTLHESVRSALDRITPDLIGAAVRAGARACALLGIAQPSIGLFGINPHASEGGLFGPDDEALAVPAAAALRAEGLHVDGPIGADLLLAARKHDLYVAMLHDQGHIPIKLLAPNAASALSIGADVLLSSVGHGSAMDIAGQGIADAGAVIRTIGMLSGMQPAAHREPTESPT
ncbi:1,2-dihydroxy-3,5-cyclohexadiene-1, 4-dicarboxylate dehydrogenase [Burkholderiales bacterium 8X]|nr:1,2-dihydroxy-3,5-cyclohexadiene-1, 4-dicarboxylate dehydrogenase [Burkholderiales bacterium 8X]